MSPVRKREPIVCETAKILSRHLKKNKMTLNKFCTDNGLTYSSMHEFMFSTRTNPPVWKIAKILKITGHKILIVPTQEEQK